MVHTPWSRVLVKLTTFPLDKKFPVIYGTRWFITIFTSAHTIGPVLTQLDVVHYPTS